MVIGRSQFLAQGVEGIAIARGGGVERNVQLPGNFIKGEFAPNLKRKHLALCGGQAMQCGLDGHAAVVGFGEGLKARFGFLQAALGPFLPSSAALVAAGEIKCGPADGSEKECLRFAAEGTLMPPKADKGILHHILGIGQRTGPLPRAKQQARTVPLKPICP